jgi:hypothetical protein
VADLIRLREDAELPETGFPRYGDIRPAFFRLVNILSLNRNETNQSRRIAFQDRIAKMWQRTSSGLNPWPAVAFLSAFERIPVDSTARAVIQGVLHEYPDPPRWSASRDLGGDLQVERIEADGRSHARYSQPLGKRPVFPFQWAESGTWLEGGKDEPVMHPGVDLLLPYWIGRDVAVTPSEDSIAPLDLKLRPQTGLGGKTNSTVSTNLPRRPGPAPRAPTGASNSPARR